MWSVTMNAQTLTAAADLLVLKAPTDHRIHIELVRVAADVGTSNVSGPIALYNATDIGTGGTTVTPVSTTGSVIDPWTPFATAGASATRNPSGAPTKVDQLRRIGGDLRTGWVHTKDDHGLIILQPAGILVVRLDGTIASTVVSAEILFKIV